ncbi:hypothetical protein GOP47_0016843, partial [Adiantum capillus-veneris]
MVSLALRWWFGTCLDMRQLGGSSLSCGGFLRERLRLRMMCIVIRFLGSERT